MKTDHTRLRRVLGLAAGSIMILQSGAVSADAKLGGLTCHRIAGTGINLLIHSKADVRCTFEGSEGSKQWYVGETGVGLGLDLKWNKVQTLYFFALSSTVEFAPEGDFLTGKYAGAKADAAVGVGVGAALLVGGSDRTASLQPSVETSQGIGVAIGVGYLNIGPDPLNQARMVTPQPNLMAQVMYAGYFDRAFGHYHQPVPDYAGSDYFADRATAAASGPPPASEQISTWPLPGEVHEEASVARAPGECVEEFRGRASCSRKGAGELRLLAIRPCSREWRSRRAGVPGCVLRPRERGRDRGGRG